MVVVSAKDIVTGEKKLIFERNPMRQYWLTKKGMRRHKNKKEFELMHNLDMFKTYHHTMPHEIFRQLNNYPASGYVSMKQICKSPYVYGADIDIEP